MILTPAQLSTLKTHLAANSNQVSVSGAPTAISAVPHSPDNAQTVADWYNLFASPDFILWDKSVNLTDVGNAFVATELAGLTQINLVRLQTLAQYSPVGFNPSRADIRASFDDIFSGAGGQNTRAALLALWKRLATNIEKVYAVGTGSDASPAISAFADGAAVLTRLNVEAAWAAA